MNAQIMERCRRLRTLYKSEPVFKENLYYQRVRRQRLNYMRAMTRQDDGAYTARLRRAYAEAAVLDDMAPVIHPDELIVGLPDVSPLTPEEQAEYAQLEVAMRGSFYTGTVTIGHMALDYPKLLRVGVNGLLQEVQERLAALDLNDPENLSKCEFYEGCVAELEALLRLQKRYHDHALALAAQAEGRQKQEYEQIAANLAVVPAQPPQTFHQALQSIHFYNFCLWELYYFGRVDQYLIDYYRQDVAAGRLTYEQAVELYACFLLMPEGYIMPNVALDAMVGGVDPQGNPVENEVTHLAIDAIAYAQTANGKVCLSVTDRTSEALLRKAIRLNAQGLTQPALYNDRVITEGFMKVGMPPEHARYYCNTGCVEMTPIGMSGMYVVAPYHNLPAYLLKVLEEQPAAASLDELLDRLMEETRSRVFKENLAINRRQMERARNGCEPMRACCLVSDCLSRGQGIDEGGGLYNFIEPNFVGIGTTIDSLAVVNELVFLQKKYALPELVAILKANYQGHEALRQYILNKLPHFGMNEDFTDQLACRLTRMLKAVCQGIRTYRGSTLIPGAFSYIEHDHYGRVTGATPDGRVAGYPLSSGSSPVQGREIKGPTAAMLSATCWDHEDFIGGITVNMKFSADQMSGEAEDKMLTFIRTFMERGGMQLQLNCVNRDTLLAAREHPEDYGDLLVRVGGFSAYFCKLSPQIQQEIIDRNEHRF